MGAESFRHRKWRHGVLSVNKTVFLFPNIPTVKPIQEDGHFHPAWRQWFQQMTSIIQNNLSPHGFIMPQQPTTTISSLNTAASKGTIIYDETTDQFKGNLAGTFKIFTLT